MDYSTTTTKGAEWPTETSGVCLCVCVCVCVCVCRTVPSPGRFLIMPKLILVANRAPRHGHSECAGDEGEPQRDDDLRRHLL
eukprot:COSAG03_NODE_751_length_5994_cov_17.493130_4_plen_82_part_00